MGIEDILAKTNKALSKSTEKKPFSFGHDMPSLASERGGGDPELWIPCPVFPLNCALGGGLAIKRVSEVYSDHEGDGKTTLALLFMAMVQSVGGTGVWFESETALDKPRASAIGVQLDKLILWTPDTLEDGFRYLGELLRNIASDKDQKSKPTLVVWDTISMARSEAERDGDAFRDGMMISPRIISQALKNYNQEFAANNVHFMMVNQSYTKVGDKKSVYLGPQYETHGGKRIKFVSTYRIKCKKIGYIGRVRAIGPKDEKLGIKVRITIPKNKLALPYRSVDLCLYGNVGYSDVMSMATMFSDDGVYKWPEGLSHVHGGRYKLIHMPKAVYWDDIEKAVLDNPDTLSAWRQRWLQIFPISEARQPGEDGWYRAVPGEIDYNPTPRGILSARK